MDTEERAAFAAVMQGIQNEWGMRLDPGAEGVELAARVLDALVNTVAESPGRIDAVDFFKKAYRLGIERAMP